MNEELLRVWDDAINISGKKKLDAMVAVMEIEPAVFRYLQAVGLNESDAVAIREKTIRGQDVVEEMFSGMLEGLKVGLERLAKQDGLTREVIMSWLEGKDA